MTEQCPTEWVTDEDDEDGDGKATHACYLPAGHGGDWCYCAWHLCCTPVGGLDSWAAEGEAC